MLSPLVQFGLLWESWEQSGAGEERPQGGRGCLELCDEMMVPSPAKRKVGKSLVCLDQCLS